VPERKVSARSIQWVCFGSLLSFLSAAPIFWNGFIFLGETWITPEYSHGPLISLYLFLRELRDIEAEKVAAAEATLPRRWTGVLIIGLGLFFGLASNITQIPDISTYGMIIWTDGIRLGSRQATPTAYSATDFHAGAARRDPMEDLEFPTRRVLRTRRDAGANDEHTGLPERQRHQSWRLQTACG